MSAPSRAPYDRWRDVNGRQVPIGARVRQVAIAKTHGALASRLDKDAEVLAYGRGCRLHIRFEDEQCVRTIRPHLVRLLPILTPAEVGARVRALHELIDARLGSRG